MKRKTVTMTQEQMEDVVRYAATLKQPDSLQVPEGVAALIRKSQRA